ncbi:21 kDa protein-like [Cicer arietinum]|uniref:21 kDa protein-like n=1 Tax=Cicer arietinum TaxID=3827 RepID=A0A1S2Y6N7_CICAR|nr:21 kDa protein-like [Cicer arietinum]
MAKGTTFTTLLFFLLIITFLSIAISTPTNFIKSSCSTTQYPTLCVESLSTYASTIQQDPHQLVQTAISISLNKTQSTKDFVTRCKNIKGLKAREYAALHDCSEEISDSVDRLIRSLKELKICKIKGEDFNWHISNVETWVSSALTDETTCGDGFGGKALNGRIKASIRSRMINVAQVTSNALALVNHYASNH